MGEQLGSFTTGVHSFTRMTETQNVVPVEVVASQYSSLSFS